ncbi:helix-turn-helix domain-containing protein [Epilithonimonas pallida]|uniref:helix-turn-helix domain-containing protein n=1 Tax=Epilithonimonas pallida TaxID=373671 RepID=UPI003211EEDF
MTRDKNSTQNIPVKIKHKEIPKGLGTSREVVSRVLKKLKMKGKFLKMKMAKYGLLIRHFYHYRNNVSFIN